MAAMPNVQFSWVHENGKRYERYGEGFFTKDHPIDVYQQYVAPRGLPFTVVSVDGSKVTIDKKALVASKNIEVWHDNTGAFNQCFKQGNVQVKRVDWTKDKTFGFSGRFYLQSTPGVEMIGDNTTWYSPHGTDGLSYWVVNCPGYKQKGIRFQANFEGVSYGDGGGMLVGHSDGCDIDVDMENTITAGVIVSNTKGGRVQARYKSATGIYIYGGWCMNTVDGTQDFLFENTSIESPTIYSGFEAYGGKNNTFKNIKGINARASSNTSDGMKIDGFELRFTRNSRPGWMDVSDPTINMNLNNNRPNDEGGKSYIRNGKIIFEDYVDDGRNFKRGIVIQGGVNGVTIENVQVIYKAPVDERAHIGAAGIISHGKNVLIKDCLVEGKGREGHPGGANILMEHGTMENVKADIIHVNEGTLKNVKCRILWKGKDVKIGEGCEIGQIINW